MYQTIAEINSEHGVFLVQDRTDFRIYVKKILDIYNYDVYKSLHEKHIQGTPLIKELIKEEDRLIVIEEYISGISLKDKILEADYSVRDVLSYIKDLCAILENLHNQDKAIIHRDIKPANIIINSFNRAILLDFNAAKFYAEEAEDTMLLGTRGYAAPEQYGFGSSTVQSDIYALGILSREMLSSINVQDKKLLSICQKCTELSPKQRYQDVKELKEALYHYEHPFSLSYFKPVGFRSGKPLNMIISTTVYIFLFFIISQIKIGDVTGLKLWFERLGYFIIFISLIFVTFDYRGIQNSFLLCRSKNPVLKIIGVIILNLCVVMLILVSWMILEGIIFPQ